MSNDTGQKAELTQEQVDGADAVAPLTNVASAVLSAFFDELEKNEDLKDKAERLRALILTDGVVAEPAIRAILLPDAT